MPAELVRASESLLVHVAEPAARSILLGCCAAGVLAALRVKNVSVRVVVWRGVLVAALAMPLLGLMVLPVRVSLPAPVARVARYVQAGSYPVAEKVQTQPEGLKANEQMQASTSELKFRPPKNRATGSLFVLRSSVRHEEQDPMEFKSRPARVSIPANGRIPWAVFAAAIYAAIWLVFLLRVWLGVRVAGRLERLATSIEDAGLLKVAGEVARVIGLRMAPRLAESGMLAVPVTLGVRRPVILFPTEWREWETGEKEAVLAHEISHVARRDALFQRLALIHRAIFWFSPFAWWLERHLVDLSEQASDEAALESGADRMRYAETLLGFFAILEGAPQRVWWQGVSMAKVGQAEKRVDRILAWRGTMTKRLTRSLTMALVAVAAPVVMLTASVHPAMNDSQEPVASVRPPHPPVPQVAPAPAAPPAAAAPVTTIAPPPAEPTGASVAPIAPLAAIPPIGPGEAIAPVAAWPAELQEPVPTPPAIAGNSDAAEEARYATQVAWEALVKAKRQVRAAKERTAESETEANLDAVKKAMAAYEAAVGKYKASFKQYYTRVAEAREVEAAAQNISGISGGIYGGVYGGVSGGVGGRPYAQSAGSSDEQYRIVGSYSGDSGPRFVIVTKGTEGVTMSGTEEDAEHARALRGKIPSDFIWFERDEKSYIIRDAATVERAKKLWAPEEELGKKQEELGKQQEELGKQQEALGQKMEQVRVKIPDMSAEMQALMAKMKELGANGGTQEEIGELQNQIGELQSRVGEIQSDAGRQQSEIGRQQSELGRKQGVLGRQQGDLGRQQGELAKQATKEMKDLLDEAIAHGTAQPE